MKPENAIALPVASDLSAHALTEAESLVRGGLKDFCNDSAFIDVRMTLHVPSQLMPEAIKYAFCLGHDVRVSFDYDRDEWSLHGSIYQGAGRKDVIVWSPGA